MLLRFTLTTAKMGVIKMPWPQRMELSTKARDSSLKPRQHFKLLRQHPASSLLVFIMTSVCLRIITHEVAEAGSLGAVS